MGLRLEPIPVPWVIVPHGTTQLSADKTVTVFKAPYACTVVSGGHVQHRVALTKSATNYYDISVLNGGAAGAGTSVIATKSFKSTTVTAADISALTLTSTAAWQKLDADDYVVVKYDETGALTLGGEFVGCFFIVYGLEV